MEAELQPKSSKPAEILVKSNQSQPSRHLFEEYDLDTSLCDYQANLKEEYKKDMEEYKNDE